jgi:hypothetical protein
MLIRPLALVAMVTFCSCSGDGGGAPPLDGGNDSSARDALAGGPPPHTTDLASHMPPSLAIMDVMAWFGIPAALGGPDSAWGNWHIPAFNCVPARDPLSCDDAGERAIASRYRPLDGIYSSSGRDAEGLAHIKLMLSNLRAPAGCDSSARLDALGIQQGGLAYSSLHGGNAGGAVELAYQSLLHFLDEADAEGRSGAIVLMNDTTWYWNNGKYEKLDCAASRATCIANLQQDVIDLIQIGTPHPSALRLGGKLLLYLYLDGAAGFPTVTEWTTIFANARAATGQDFYTLATHAPSRYFDAFDALAPWVEPLDTWTQTSGTTVYAHAQAYAAAQIDPLIKAAPAGKVVFGGVAPGFDDFTKDWGSCVERQMPPPSEAPPRHLDVLRGQIDYLKSKGLTAVTLHTWDDFTEGTFFEPSVEEGVTKLIALRQKLGDLFGEAQSASADEALAARWTSYGKTYPCSGGVGAYDPPKVCSQ